MSLPDPLPIATDPVSNLPKISSPVGQSKFRKEFDTGSTLVITFFQNGNSKRARHLVRFDIAYPPNANGIVNSFTLSVTIDEPANGAVANADIVYYMGLLKSLLDAETIGRMLNEEL